MRDYREYKGTVGVVITNYNQADYLRVAVDSVLRQTRLPDRVIVVDDGSVDNSAEVLDALPAAVEVVRQDNRGVVDARNRALDMLETTYVLFVDADDYLLPGFLRWTTLAWRLPHSRRLGVVYTPCRNINADGQRGYLHSRVWDPADLRRENYISNLALFSRAALVDVKGYSRIFNRIGLEDWDLFLRLAEHGWTGRIVPAPLWCYRQLHGGRNAIALEQRKREVEAAIDALHPVDQFNTFSAWHWLIVKATNRAQTILRNRDARRWMRVEPVPQTTDALRDATGP